VRDRLFMRFASGSSGTGTGLGLYIVRELARMHGGDAWYEPVPEGGAAFVLTLPAEPPTDH
jgi:signal transduction histidine kinase